MTDQELAEEMSNNINRLEALNKKAIRRADKKEGGELTAQLLRRSKAHLKEAHLQLWAACRSAGLNEGK